MLTVILADNFYKQGYTFEYKKPDFIEDERVRNVIEGLVQAKDYMKGTRVKFLGTSGYIHQKNMIMLICFSGHTSGWMKELKWVLLLPIVLKATFPPHNIRIIPEMLSTTSKRHPLRSDPKNQNLLIMEYINKKF